MEINETCTLYEANKKFRCKDYLGALRIYHHLMAGFHPISFFIRFNYRYALRKYVSLVGDIPFHYCSPLICLNLRGDEVNAFSSIQIYIEEVYGKKPEFNNYIVVLGYNLGDLTIDQVRDKYPGSKIVIYQLEQLSSPDNLWFNEKHKLPMVRSRTKRIDGWLKGADEIWDYDISNIRFLESKGYSNIYHFPLLYSSSIDRKRSGSSKDIDILFYGSINKRRAEILSNIPNSINFRIIGNYSQLSEKEIENYNLNNRFLSKTPVFGANLNEIIDRSKFILNIHYYEGCIQEQARLFELISNGKKIISESSSINYYGDLIYENSYNVLKNNFSHAYSEAQKLDRQNVSLLFREKIKRPYRIAANYNTFYGIRLLKTSIESLRSVVDYVVVVHQKVSFSGVKQSEEDWQILKELKHHGYIDELIIFDFSPGQFDKPTDGMIAKRNIGLDCIKNNKCDFVITLDSDECYSANDILKSINYMWENKIDTMYSPILAYYGDFYHYFQDTYFVPSVYRVGSDRRYRKIHAEILCDPARKMREAKYFIAYDCPMHHLTYIPEEINNKIDSKIINSDLRKKDEFLKIRNYLSKWKSGEDALVFRNSEGKGAEVELSMVGLTFTQEILF